MDETTRMAARERYEETWRAYCAEGRGGGGRPEELARLEGLFREAERACREEWAAAYAAGGYAC